MSFKPIEVKLIELADFGGDPDDCVEWLGSTIRGYGYVGVHGKTMLAHRASYEFFVGPIPEGLHLDHLCRNRSCINPTHLEPVSQGENNARALPYREDSDVCRNGHPYTGLTDYRGYKKCATCKQGNWTRANRKRQRVV